MSITSAITALRAMADNAGRVWTLIKDGYSVEQAVEQDERLKLALKDLADDYFKQSDAHILVAKQIFAPETVTPSEQAWMDRASSSTGQ